MTKDKKKTAVINCSSTLSFIVDNETASSSSSSAPSFIKRRQHNNNSNNNINNNINNNNCSKQDNSENNDCYFAYHRLCEIRMRRLERYKKARSFCSLHAENSNNLNSTINSTQLNNFSMNNNINQNKNFVKSVDSNCNNYTKFDNIMRATSSSCSHLVDVENNKFSHSVNLNNQKQTEEVNDFMYKRYKNNDNQYLQFASSYCNLLLPSESSFVHNNKSNLTLQQLLKSDTTQSKLHSNLMANNSKNDNRTNQFLTHPNQQTSLNCQFEILRDKMVTFFFNYC